MEMLQHDVLKFMKAGQERHIPVPFTPSLPKLDTIKLASDLLVEECKETINALAELECMLQPTNGGSALTDVVLNNQIALIADGYIDTIYVCLWGLTAFGIDAEAVWNEVQKTNMAKIDPKTGKAIQLANGKIVKPEGWKPPAILRIIRAQAILDMQRKKKAIKSVEDIILPELTERQLEMMTADEPIEPNLEDVRKGLGQSFNLHEGENINEL